MFDDRYIVDYRATLSDINSLHKVVTVPYWSRESGLYRPFTLLTYSFNYILLGSDPWGFHLINLILYALTGFLIFIIIKKLFKNNLLAYVTSGLFLVLPIHTEVVANIIGRAEILMLFFSLLVIWELTKEKINFWRTGLWFLFAIGSKETAIAMLPIILLVIYLIERGKNSKNVIRKYVPSFISVSVASLIYFGSSSADL